MDVVVTVGMGPWPFDRLISALEPLTRQHRVFAQVGTSSVQPSCEHAAFVPMPEMLDRIESADVVITHAGNTVRLVQRMGRMPVSIARTARLHEMGNDHQVDYLRAEERAGRVQAVWDVGQLETAVQIHGGRSALQAQLAPVADAEQVADNLDALWDRLQRNPFRDHPLRRYAFGWDELAGVEGPHLDLGIGDGVFVGTLAQTTSRPCSAADVHPGYVAAVRAAHPAVDVRQYPASGQLPFPDGAFASVSLLDVLEHCACEDDLLREVHRVLRPGGLLVVTVPGRHVFSGLDPDNAKYRVPRLHKAVYSRAFGPEIYHQRFVDTSDGLIGDIAAGRGEHTNYRLDDLMTLMRRNDFSVQRQTGANLFWRLLHGPALLSGPRTRRALERAIRLDGQMFSSANLFLTLRRS